MSTRDMVKLREAHEAYLNYVGERMRQFGTPYRGNDANES